MSPVVTAFGYRTILAIIFFYLRIERISQPAAVKSCLEGVWDSFIEFRQGYRFEYGAAIYCRVAFDISVNDVNRYFPTDGSTITK